MGVIVPRYAALLLSPLFAAALYSGASSGALSRVPAISPEARAEAIGFRLATRAAKRCATSARLTGIAIQILGQFVPRDRAAAIAAYRLDRGPRIVAVAPDSPGALAGLMADDIILTVNGRAMAPPADLAAPLDQAGNLAALDRFDADLVDVANGPSRLTVLRNGSERAVSLVPTFGCPLYLHVARSGQHNAFADGTHVLLPTGLIDWIRDDDQLALAIAHEMAHNILGHAAQLRSLPRTANRTALLRRQEDAADVLGADLALDAGYDVVAGSKLFLLISGGIELSPTHRGAKGRIGLTLAQARLREPEPPVR